jgi:hypothetical protein
MTKDERLLLQSVSARLDQVHEALYGNGDPTKSMMASQVRQEAGIVAAAASATRAAEKADALAAKIDIVVTSVNQHHSTLHLSSLLKSAKFWGYGLLAFVGVNLLVDVGRPLAVALIKAWTGVQIP